MDRQCPPEIIELIVKASLDPVDRDFFPTGVFGRYSILKCYSLLNSTWREVCKPSLYKVVVIESESAGFDFVRVAARQGGVIGGVELMDIWCDGWTGKRPTALLQCVPQLRSLTLHYAAFHAEDLANSHRLDEISLIRCTIASPSPPTQLPIRHLCVRTSAPYQAVEALLTPASLPRLQNLDLYPSWTVDINAIVPQLTAMALDDRTALRHAPNATSLRLLSVDSSEVIYVLSVLAPLARLPPFLLISAIYYSLHLIQALKYQVANPKTGVKTIFADRQYVDDPTHAKELDQLIVELGSKGIVVELGRFTFLEAIRRMDAIILAERRAAEEREKLG